ncbi:MAG: WYL domain-containing protein, partial [Acidimicrobiales bacterium]|nr:WYL domain-containing protein [Acidimicrobiales bacterium]
GEQVPHLATLSRAVWEERRLELRYAKRDGEVRRAVDPLGLVLKAGVWYLVALSGRTRSPRTFRVSRVVGVQELDAPVARPEGFDLARHWADAGEAFFEAIARVEVRIRIRAERLRGLRHVLDPASAQAAIDGAEPPDVEGWVTTTILVEHLEMAAEELLRFGGDVEVLAPSQLRDQMVGTAAALAARYATA